MMCSLGKVNKHNQVLINFTYFILLTINLQDHSSFYRTQRV